MSLVSPVLAGGFFTTAPPEKLFLLLPYYIDKYRSLPQSSSESESEVVSDSATPWTVAHQAPPSMGFSRQEYWSGLPFPSPGDLPDPGIELRSPALRADALTPEPPGNQSSSRSR